MNSGDLRLQMKYTTIIRNIVPDGDERDTHTHIKISVAYHLDLVLR